ncbi:hypothetical protein ACFL5K_03600 [Gemmatimonadota bacterium]
MSMEKKTIGTRGEKKSVGSGVKTISEGRIFKGGRNPEKRNTPRPNSKLVGQGPKSSDKKS